MGFFFIITNGGNMSRPICVGLKAIINSFTYYIATKLNIYMQVPSTYHNYHPFTLTGYKMRTTTWEAVKDYLQSWGTHDSAAEHPLGCYRLQEKVTNTASVGHQKMPQQDPLGIIFSQVF